MQFGYFTLSDNRYPGNTRTANQFVLEIREQALLADKLGYHSAWIGEHHFDSLGVNSRPDLLLASIAPLTENIRLSPAVSVLPLHHPVHVAETWATLDLISNGRVDFACGRSDDLPGGGCDAAGDAQLLVGVACPWCARNRTPSLSLCVGRDQACAAILASHGCIDLGRRRYPGKANPEPRSIARVPIQSGLAGLCEESRRIRLLEHCGHDLLAGIRAIQRRTLCKRGCRPGQAHRLGSIQHRDSDRR